MVYLSSFINNFASNIRAKIQLVHFQIFLFSLMPTLIRFFIERKLYSFDFRIFYEIENYFIATKCDTLVDDKRAEMNTQMAKKRSRCFNSRTFLGQSDSLSLLPGSLEKSEFPTNRLRESSLVEFDKRDLWKSIRLAIHLFIRSWAQPSS